MTMENPYEEQGTDDRQPTRWRRRLAWLVATVLGGLILVALLLPIAAGFALWMRNRPAEAAHDAEALRVGARAFRAALFHGFANEPSACLAAIKRHAIAEPEKLQPCARQMRIDHRGIGHLEPCLGRAFAQGKKTFLRIGGGVNGGS